LKSAFFWDVVTPRHTGCLVPVFRDSVQVSCWRVEMSIPPLKMKLCCVETSGTSEMAPHPWERVP